MTPSPDQPHAVRRVLLPSGKTIEVVYFEDERTGTAVPVGPGEELHHCPRCTSDLVYPIAWEEATVDSWELQLRCPNCEWEAEGVYDRPIVERLDEELDRGTHILLRDLKQLMHANMEDEVERFVAALQADAVLPEDF
jgi:hypothetical protein